MPIVERPSHFGDSVLDRGPRAPDSPRMSKGYDEHQGRLRSLASFGKDLARRARSKCELCEAAGVPLTTFEVAPTTNPPEFAHLILVCEVCAEGLAKEKFPEPSRWRCLNNTVWSETPAVQVAAVRILRALAKTEPWASDLLESVYLEPEVTEWADKG